MPMSVRPLRPNFGIEVRGIRLPDLDDAAFDALVALYYRHSLLVFPDQHLTAGEQAFVTARFGTPSIAPRREHNHQRHPEIVLLGNLRVNGEPAAFLNRQGVEWHSDSAGLADPDVATLLSAVAVPKTGGDTMWCDMHTAWETLPASIRERIDGRTVLHSWNHHNDKVLSLSPGAFKPLSPAERARHPDVWDDLVQVHPVTGRTLYFISHNLAIAISGLEPAETKTLTAALVEHAIQSDNLYRHRWSPGDIAIWDNHAVMHSATEVTYDDDLRLMHRSSCRTHPHAWMARMGRG